MKKFNEIVSRVFEVKAEDIKDEWSSKDIPHWDSMNYLLLITELEKHFGVTFTADEVLKATCVGDIRKVIHARAQRT